MADPADPAIESKPSPYALRFGISELAGSLGDFGTIIPLILGVSLVSGMDAGYIFLFFGIWFIIVGLYYGLPIPVEPMKVIAVVAIAQDMGAGEIAAAGLMLGVLFLLLGYGTILTTIEKWIPRSVIRGIQFGLALLLIRTAIGFLIPDPFAFVAGMAIIVAGFFIARRMKAPDLSSLVLIGVAIGVGVYLNGIPTPTLLSVPHLVIPPLDVYPGALVTLVAPQAVLTVTNAILATALLSRDLFSPGVDSPKLSRTIGLMNLLSVPFGGMPMCHGAGGLAGQYRFGARTGGANIYAGLILLAVALVFAGPGFLDIISSGFYAALLVFVAIELFIHGMKTDSYPVTGVVGIVALATSMTAGFVAGMILAYLLPKPYGVREKKES
ncbi:MFS superfamily sulfate permease-like transporter [Methanolinea mesophila]|uniref:putative sulfate/molybdate transporter n=1 Tax=Methanolinea mesophila TaxID=547055 RepID=UPI001AE67EBD|nr:putative sulfate/molybdate transporter [Methanolinea mesophila]MBP1929551.1 MFS superfamily sulfate permease-like transporter [Methanolinea mesophila]